jgi:hypothetical protein
MKTYICLLRGINLSRQKQVKRSGINRVTRTGLPVILSVLFGLLVSCTQLEFDPQKMWAVEAGDNRLPQAGYKMVPDIESYPVYLADEAIGAYHHHPVLLYYNDRVYAAFSEGSSGEDGPGQRVRVTTSSDGKKWSKSVLALDAVDDYSRDWKEAGRMSTPISWIVVDDRVWIVSDVTNVTGFTDEPGGKKIVSKVRKSGLQRVLVFFGYFVSEVLPDGNIGDQFWLNDEAPEFVRDFPSIVDITVHDPKYSTIRENIVDEVTKNQTRVGPEERLKDTRIAQDDHLLGEHTIYQRSDGVWIQLARDLNYSHFLYSSESKDGKKFSTPLQTNIPDSPSKTLAGSLPDGRIYIIGNFVHNPEQDATKKHYKRYPLVLALSRDGKTFDKSFAVRAKPTVPRFEVGGSSDGYQYPDAVIVGDTMWIIYSENKQDIYISKLNWQEL